MSQVWSAAVAERRISPSPVERCFVQGMTRAAKFRYTAALKRERPCCSTRSNPSLPNRKPFA